jgi:hypothetical protein
MPIHTGELKFVFEIRYRAQATQDHLGLTLAGEFHQQDLKTAHLDTGNSGERLACQFDAFLPGKKRILAGIPGHRDDGFGAEATGALDQITMPRGNGIEGTGIDGDGLHAHTITEGGLICQTHGQVIMHLTGAFTPQQLPVGG